MILSLLVPVLLIVVVVVLARRGGGTSAPPGGARSVRRFFQYVLLLGLVVVVAIGASGLLARALESQPVTQDDVELARNLAFVVVGTPLLALVVSLSWRQLAADPAERSSTALAFTVLLAGVISLVMVMTAAHGLLMWLLDESDVSSRHLGVLVVWGVVLAATWWASTIIAPAALRLYHLVGSLLGLGTAATGLVALLSDGLSRATLGPSTEILDPWRSGLASLLVGAPVWALYWWARARRAERDTPWYAFVVLAGVGGGFVAALVAFSWAVATTGIWLLGEPTIDVVDLHFHDVPEQAAIAVVGLLVWWYHRMVLGEARTAARTGVQRVYEYLMAGIALVAAAIGVTFLVAAGLEAVAGEGTDPGRGPVANTLVVAATVLLVGLPVWGVFWRRAQLARRADPLVECASTARRTYLALLVGVGAVAAVVAAITGAYQLFEDVVTTTAGSDTVLSMRYPIGIVLAAGAVAAGNVTELRRDRRLLPSTHAPAARQVLLVGPADPEVARAVARSTGAKVQTWWTDDDAPWSIDDVVAAVHRVPSDVVVLSDAGGLRVIPVRGPSTERAAAPAMLSR